MLITNRREYSADSSTKSVDVQTGRSSSEIATDESERTTQAPVTHFNYSTLLAELAARIVAFSPKGGFASSLASASSERTYQRNVSPLQQNNTIQAITEQAVTPVEQVISYIIKIGTLSIKDITSLRGVNRGLRDQMDEHIRQELADLQNKGPALIRDFLSQKSAISTGNAWNIFKNLKETYPTLNVKLPIHKACIDLERQYLSSLVTLKTALLEQNRNTPALHSLGPVADEFAAIRAWFEDPNNQVALQSVTNLHLSNRNLFIIPQEIKYLTKLTILNFSNTQIIAIPNNAFHGLTNLQYLNLQRNQITAIPEHAFHGLTNLQSLYLEHNSITDIPEHAFHGLTNLQYLNLQDNQITDIPEHAFHGLTNLQYLHLQDNQITAIAKNAFHGLTNLQFLYLQCNQITAIAKNAFHGLTNLQELRLDGNPSPLDYSINRRRLLRQLRFHQ